MADIPLPGLLMRILSLFLSTLLLLPALSPARGLAEAPAQVQVLTDIPPVHSLAAQVMADAGAPMLLLGRGADPHHFQLRPSQARAIAGADLIFMVGPELTPWLGDVLRRLGAGERAVALLHAPGTLLLEAGAGEAGGPDPHAWLDPRNGAVWADRMARELAARDPDPARAAAYRANAAHVQSRMAALEAEISARLAALGARPVIVQHQGYAYFARRFSVNIVAAISDSEARPPGARHMRALREMVESGAVACVFTIEGHDPGLAESLIAGADVALLTLPDPLGSALPPGPDHHEALLRALADAFAACGDDARKRE